MPMVIGSWLGVAVLADNNEAAMFSPISLRLASNIFRVAYSPHFPAC